MRIVISALCLAVTACGASGSPGLDSEVDSGAGLDGGSQDRAAQDAPSPRDSGSDGADGGVTDAGSSSDLGGGHDGSTMDARTVDVGTGPRSACPAAMGIMTVGRQWTMQSNAAYEAEHGTSYTTRSEVLEINDQGDHTVVVFTYEQDLSGDGFQSRTTGSQTARCDSEGYSIAEFQFSTVTVASGQTTRSNYVTRYQPALRTMIHDPLPGATFSGASTATTEGVSGGQPFSSATAVSHNSVVRARMSVTVPAGTWADALPVDANWGGSQGRVFYADGVGNIATDQAELVSYR